MHGIYFMRLNRLRGHSQWCGEWSAQSLLYFVMSTTRGECIIQTANLPYADTLLDAALDNIHDDHKSKKERAIIDLDMVIDGAPSLDLIVRYMERVPEEIVPEDVRPSTEIVNFCLAKCK